MYKFTKLSKKNLIKILDKCSCLLDNYNNVYTFVCSSLAHTVATLHVQHGELGTSTFDFKLDKAVVNDTLQVLVLEHALTDKCINLTVLRCINPKQLIG